MGISSADSEPSLSLTIEVIKFGDDYWSSLDLYLPERENIQMDEFYALLDGISTAKTKIEQLLEEMGKND